MQLKIIPIGNSKGIRIPKTILEQCHITTCVEMDVHSEHIILKSPQKKPREGWNQAFKQMAHSQEDKLLIDDTLDWNDTEWIW